MFSYSLPRWRKLAACAQFTIQNFLCRPHSHPSHCSHNRPCGSHPPLAQACSLCPIHNSKFPPRPTYPICPTCRTRPTIHNSPPPLYFSIRLPSSSYLNVQPCHFFKWLTYCRFAPAQHYLFHTYTYCRFAPARHYPCLSSVIL